MVIALALGFETMRFLDNGQIRLGVDLDKGGAITYLSRTDGPNMVNDADLGRQIQMSYYSGPNPFEPNGKKPNAFWAGLGWNPIQSGDVFGNHSKILDFRSSSDSIYVKCVPMHWPLDNEPGECTFESWIRLEGSTVELKQRIVNSRPDHTQYPAHGQELPAVYVNAPWHRLITYVGDRPFTNDATTEIPQHEWGASGPWTSFFSSESWAALVDETGSGLGVWAPDTYTFSGGFVGKPVVGGSHDGPTGYISPNRIEILDHNIAYESRCVLIVGGLTAIRNYVESHSKPSTKLEWRFGKDRQHWYTVNATDTGWPIEGRLNVPLGAADPQLISPAFWAEASKLRHLRLDAAFRTQSPTIQVFWSRSDAQGFSEERSRAFPVVADGKRRAYRFDLAEGPGYSGLITQIRIDPEPEGHPDDRMEVWSISLER